MPVMNMAKIIKVDRVHVLEVIYAKLYEVFSTSLNRATAHTDGEFCIDFLLAY